MNENTLTLADYQRQAVALMNPALSRKDQRAEAGLGIAAETGEVLDLLKKHWHHQKPLDPHALKLELGDLCWYVVAGAHLVCKLKLEPPQDLPACVTRERCSEAAFQLAATAGKVAKTVGYAGVHRRVMSFSSLQSILSSMLYEVAIIAAYYGWTLTDVLQSNLDKLHARYPARVP